MGNVETLADLLFEIGRDLGRKNDHYRATKWLERAHGVLSSCNDEQLSNDAVELRMTVAHHLVRAYVGLKTEQSLEKAEDLLASMETVRWSET